MDMIYISHPYTGMEVKNRKSAEEIARTLAVKFPHIIFVNPLNAMRHLRNTKIPYDAVLAQCKALLANCNGIIMAGDWKDSKGCMAEFNFAKEMQIPIWENVREYYEDNVMPNDCCGKHNNCKRCVCRKCAHRLACWNCNDCTKAPGEKPIGYTGNGVWECSRYSKRSE